MTTITKMVLCFCLLLFASPLHAALGDLQVRELEAFHNSAYFDYNDSHLMNIDYIGSSSEAVMGVGAGTITMHAPFGTADTNFGAGSDDGAYDFTAEAYNTLGELCDAIDALTYYNCKLTGGKRDDDPVLLENVTMVSGSYDAKPAGGYNILIDTGGAVDTDPYIMRLGITPQSGRRVILKGCVTQTDQVGDDLVYGKLRMYEGASDGVSRNDTTKVYHSVPSVNDTTRIIPSALWPFGEWMEFAKDEHVVIQAGDTTEPLTSTSYINCFWIER